MNIGDNLLCLGMVLCGTIVAVVFLIQVGKNNRPGGGK